MFLMCLLLPSYLNGNTVKHLRFTWWRQQLFNACIYVLHLVIISILLTYMLPWLIWQRYSKQGLHPDKHAAQSAEVTISQSQEICPWRKNKLSHVKLKSSLKMRIWEATSIQWIAGQKGRNDTNKEKTFHPFMLVRWVNKAMFWVEWEQLCGTFFFWQAQTDMVKQGTEPAWERRGGEKRKEKQRWECQMILLFSNSRRWHSTLLFTVWKHIAWQWQLKDLHCRRSSLNCHTSEIKSAEGLRGTCVSGMCRSKDKPQSTCPRNKNKGDRDNWVCTCAKLMSGYGDCYFSFWNLSRVSLLQLM